MKRRPMIKWVTAGILFLQANLSLAAETTKPVTHSDFPEFPFEQVLLGRDLFHDPILSGNRNISCASCHHAMLGSADARALSVGEGGVGLGAMRRGTAQSPAQRHIPRNAPALFNLGAAEFTTLFHDGRVARDARAPHGWRMPEGRALEAPVPLALAAQALLPILSPEEMAGSAGENEVANAVADERIRGEDGAWAILAARVGALPGYKARFEALGQSGALHITDVSTAIGAFLAYEFRASASSYDAYLAGRTRALTPSQKRGLALFNGKARCSSCHAGPFQTDHGFHAIGMPQLGPGKGHVAGDYADHGRAAITGDPADAYRFRTPSLRNVALTAPYGHSGAYATLEGVIRHHLAPRESLMAYDPASAMLPALAGEGLVAPEMPSEAEIARIAAAIEIDLPPLSDNEIEEIIAFLHALTDPSSVAGRLGAPRTVPSGLKVDSLAD